MDKTLFAIGNRGRVVKSHRTCHILDWLFATGYVEERLAIQLPRLDLIEIYCLVKNPNGVDHRWPVRGEGGGMRFCFDKKIRSGRLDHKFANKRFSRNEIFHVDRFRCAVCG